jgi:ADP-ribosylglycohydrolase
MTLALACSFFKSNMQYNHKLSIRYYVEWLTTGRFSTVNYAWDMGHSTHSALTIWKNSGMSDIELAQAEINARLDKNQCSGNGSLMRIVPVGVVYWRDVKLARQVARKQGQVTHPALPCVEACEAYTALVCGAMSGELNFFAFFFHLTITNTSCI